MAGHAILIQNVKFKENRMRVDRPSASLKSIEARHSPNSTKLAQAVPRAGLRTSLI